jgi:hypothetical protein
MGNPGGFLLLAYLTRGVNTGFLAHTTQLNPGEIPNLHQPYYRTMAYGPNIPPMGMGLPHGPIPDILFPRTLAYATPNPQVQGDNEGVRD